MIDIRFTLTEAEYFEAQKLYMRHRGMKSRWRRRIAWAIVTIGFIVALVTIPRPLSFSTIPPYTIVLFILSFYPLWIIPLQRRGLKKKFLIERQNLTNAHVQLDDSGYRIDVPGVGSGIAEWSSMPKWMEGKSVIILLTGLLMRIVPKHPLSESQLDELRQLLAKHIGPVGN